MFVDHEALITHIKSGQKVLCNTEQQRNSVLSYLRNCGYELGENTSRYLDGLVDEVYLHPGMIHGHISCWRGNQSGLPFSAFFSEDADEEELGTIDESDFLDAFFTLMGYKEAGV